MTSLVRWFKSLLASMAIAAFVLSASTGALAADPQNDWFGATGPLTPGVVNAGAVNPSGDVDWYYFYNDVPSSVTAGTVRISIRESAGSTADSTLILYRWDGGKLVHVDDIWTSSSTSINSALKAGLYYVEVRDSYNDGGTGSYEFTVSGDYLRTSLAAGSKVQLHPSSVPVVEDNRNEWWQAVGPLQSTRPYVGAVETGGDIDWYYFYNDVPSSVTAGTVRLGINETFGSTAACTLVLYRWDGGKLVKIDDMTTSYNSPINSALKAGLYYVEVRDSYNDGGTGSYDFTVAGDYVRTTLANGSKVQSHPSSISVVENNRNNWSQATGPLQSTKPYVGAVDTGGDIDWYYFYNDVPTSVSEGTVRLGINETFGSTASCTLVLYRWDGGKLVKIDDMTTSYNSPINSALKAGLYYVEVRDSYNDGGTGSYDFTVAGSYVKASRPYVSPVLGNSSTLSHGTTYTFSGYLQPAATATLQVFKYNSSKRQYVFVKSVATTPYARAYPNKFTAKWKFATAGTYRLRWVTSAPSGMTSGASRCRRFTIK